MKKILKYTILSFIIILSLADTASAHQPYLVKNKVTVVKQPEISKAYYGELKGSPDLFVINSKKPFKLYVNILTPDIKGVKNNLSIKIEMKTPAKTITNIDGAKFKWKRFYEEFGGDWYFAGPKFEKNVSGGIYIITVYNPNNRGKYSLAVGKKESFPPSAIIRTIKVLPTLKTKFFNKPLTSIFSGIIVKVFLILLVVLITVISLIIYFLIKRSKQSK